MSLRITFRVLVAFALVSCAACAEEAATTPDVRGAWKIVRWYCSDCGSRRFDEKDAVIQFGDKGITNPVGDACNDSPSYELKETTATALIAGRGRTWPASFKQSLAMHPKVREGFVLCEGINYMQVIFAPPSTLYFFSEGGLIFELERVPRKQ